MTDNPHICIDDGGGTRQEFGEIELPMMQRSISSAFLDGKTKKTKVLLLKNQRRERSNYTRQMWAILIPRPADHPSGITFPCPIPKSFQVKESATAENLGPSATHGPAMGELDNFTRCSHHRLSRPPLLPLLRPPPHCPLSPSPLHPPSPPRSQNPQNIQQPHLEMRIKTENFV